MKKFINLCLISLLLVTATIFTGCKKNKDFSLFIFSSEGGYVTIDDSEEKIDMKKTLTLNKKTLKTFSAHASNGYEFDYWEIDSVKNSEDPILVLNIEKETIVLAVFKKEGTSSTTTYTLNFVDENDISLASKQVEENETFVLPTVTDRVGFKYVFVDSADSNNVLDPTTSQFTFNYTTDKTFKLQWIATSAPSTKDYHLKFENATNSADVFDYGYVNNNDVILLNTVASAISKNDSTVKFYTSQNLADEISVINYIFNFTTDKTLYFRHFFAVSYTQSNDYTVTLENGYDWTVEEGGEIKFKVQTTSPNSTITVKYNSTDINPQNDVYTISNITANGNLEFFVNLGNTLTFKNYATDLITINDLQNNALAVDTEMSIPATKNYQFKLSLSLDLINLIASSNGHIKYSCTLNGTEIAPNNSSICTFFAQTQMNYVVEVRVISTIKFSFNYGLINGNPIDSNNYKATAILDGKVVKSSSGDYIYSIDPNDVTISLQKGNDVETLTLKQLVDQQNSQNYAGHKIDKINITGTTGENGVLNSQSFFNSLCVLDYSQGNDPTYNFDNTLLTLDKIGNQDTVDYDYTIILVWKDMTI